MDLEDGIKDGQKQSRHICIHIKICFEIFFLKALKLKLVFV